MANNHYAKGKEKILSGDIDFLTDTIKVMLVTDAYTCALTTDEFVGTVDDYRVSGTTDQTLTNKTITNGVFDAYDVTFEAVAAGNTAAALVIYKDTGDAATSPLLTFLNTATGFPFTTNGGDIKARWNSSGAGIFGL